MKKFNEILKNQYILTERINNIKVVKDFIKKFFSDDAKVIKHHILVKDWLEAHGIITRLKKDLNINADYDKTQVGYGKGDYPVIIKFQLK